LDLSLILPEGDAPPILEQSAAVQGLAQLLERPKELKAQTKTLAINTGDLFNHIDDPAEGNMNGRDI